MSLKTYVASYLIGEDKITVSTIFYMGSFPGKIQKCMVSHQESSTSHNLLLTVILICGKSSDCVFGAAVDG